MAVRFQSFDFVADPGTRAVRFPAFVGLVAGVAQTRWAAASANYAALACPDLPGCLGQALRRYFANAFHVLRELGTPAKATPAARGAHRHSLDAPRVRAPVGPSSAGRLKHRNCSSYGRWRAYRDLLLLQFSLAWPMWRSPAAGARCRPQCRRRASARLARRVKLFRFPRLAPFR